jgi:hypothetical protein
MPSDDGGGDPCVCAKADVSDRLVSMDGVKRVDVLGSLEHAAKQKSRTA